MIIIFGRGITIEEESPRPRHNQFPPDFQLDNLGITPDYLQFLADTNAQVLDLGCGDGELVRFLSEQGIKAEGLDPHAPKSSEFMRFWLTKRKIPRDNESYDLIMSHQNPDFNAGLSYDDPYIIKSDEESGYTKKKINAMNRKYSARARFALQECMRVLKRDGKMIIYPGVFNPDAISALVSPRKIEQEPCLGYLDYMQKTCDGEHRTCEEAKFCFPEIHRKRTIIK